MQNFEQLQDAKNIQYFQSRNLLLGAFQSKGIGRDDIVLRAILPAGHITIIMQLSFCVVYKRTNLPIIRVSKKVFEEMSEGRNS